MVPFRASQEGRFCYYRTISYSTKHTYGPRISINNKFNELRTTKRLALMPFLMAGDPSLELTSEILLTLQDQGADLIELGIPYSDPLADGPIIQLAASRALSGGASLLKVLS